MRQVAWVMIVAVLGTGVIALADLWTGPELSFSLFYLVPVVFAAWYGGIGLGMGLALLAMVAWFVVDLGEDKYSHPAITYWNALVRGGTFLVIAWLVARVRGLLREQMSLAVQDGLTGLENARGFTLALEHELARSRRTQQPFALAYLDLDNFKKVNDKLGHLAGDEVLRKAGHLLRARLRQTDHAARLGGDEFGVLLPETAPEGAKHLVSELHAALQRQLAAVGLNVGASVGLVCFVSAPASVDAAIQAADDLMYQVKSDGKHAVRFAVEAGGEAPLAIP